MKQLTPGEYTRLKAAAYRYVSIIDIRRSATDTVLVIKPFRDMHDADTRHSIMGIEDSLIAGAVQGRKAGFSIEFDML